MSSAADIGSGSEIAFLSGSTYTALTGILTLTLPEMTRTEIETTDMDSTDKEFRAGMRNNGSITLTQEYTDDNYQDWVARDDGNLHGCKITPNGGTGKEFDIYVAKLSLPIEMDAKMVISVELKVSGTVEDAA